MSYPCHGILNREWLLDEFVNALKKEFPTDSDFGFAEGEFGSTSGIAKLSDHGPVSSAQPRQFVEELFSSYDLSEYEHNYVTFGYLGDSRTAEVLGIGKCCQLIMHDFYFGLACELGTGTVYSHKGLSQWVEFCPSINHLFTMLVESLAFRPVGAEFGNDPSAEEAVEQIMKNWELQGVHCDDVWPRSFFPR